MVDKMEPEDPLALKRNEDTDTEEKKPLSNLDMKAQNVLNVHMVQIKMEYVDSSCDHLSEVKVEEDAAPFTCPIVKCESKDNEIINNAPAVRLSYRISL
ncbi:uncharacterized protein [Periplaneta americana]